MAWFMVKDARRPRFDVSTDAHLHLNQYNQAKIGLDAPEKTGLLVMDGGIFCLLAGRCSLACGSLMDEAVSYTHLTLPTKRIV